MKIVAIDPGINGGIAFLSADGLQSAKMPIFKIDGKGHLDIQSIREYLVCWAPHHLFLEKQQAMPKQGLASTFKTGYGYGVLIGIAAGLRIPVTEVRPADWKKALQCPADKDGARARASQLFPENSSDWAKKSDDGVAEAVLIAEYGRRLLNNVK